MPDFINNPRYQRVIQKLQGLPSWQRAIFTSAGADRQFASDEMRSKIDAINAATVRKGREESLSLRRDRFNTSTRLAEKEQDMTAKDRRLGKILGYGNIGVSGLLGYKEMETANLQAEQEQADRKKILGYMSRGGLIR